MSAEEEKEIQLEINHESRIPKFKQLINDVIDKIESGDIQYGQKLPSINQVSIEYYLSRDTVEKAYRELKKKGIIESVKGKGFYVSNSAPESILKVLVVFNKMSNYKKVVYNTFAEELGDKAHIDFFIYHNDYQMFERIINEHLDGYQYYVILPHFLEFDNNSFLKLIKKIRSDKLIILDRQVEGLEGNHGAVYQDFNLDIYNALEEAVTLFKKYKKLILVFPDQEAYPWPEEIYYGFKKFCGYNQFDFEVIDEITERSVINKGEAYVVVLENDLVSLIKKAKAQKFKLAKDIGILSYNDTALKEILADGISVITTDFERMGKTAAYMIRNQEMISVKNDFQFIKRNSL